MTRPDAIVVGAGIVGAACADALTREGITVEVLDRAGVGCGATAAGMGHVVVMDDSEAQFALTSYSRGLWDELASMLPDVVERRVTGTIWVAADSEEMDAASRRMEFYAARGVDATLLDEKSLAEAEPNLRPGLAGGLLVVGDSVIYTPAAAKWLVDRACERGGTAVAGKSARRIGDGFVLLEDGSRREADLVVVAAGTSATRLLEDSLENLEIRPKKGHLIITDRHPGFCRHQLVELGYLKSAHGATSDSVAFNLQPRATGQMLLGSSRQFDVDDPAVERRMAARMVERAAEYMPSIRELSAIRSWTGFRAATADKLPILGQHPRMPKVWMAAGHEGLGITTSLASGRVVTDLIIGRTPAIDVTPFAADRSGGASHG